MRKTEKKSIAVIDDEVQMLKVIGRYVTETLKQKNMTDKINVRLFCMAEEFLESVKKDEKYLAVFSDIEMDTMNGIELGKWLNKKHAQEKGEAIPLIFITSRRLRNATSRINTAFFVTYKQITPHRIWYNRVD